MRFLRAIVILSALTGCVSDTTGPSTSSETAFSLSATGTQDVTMTGVALRPGVAYAHALGGLLQDGDYHTLIVDLLLDL